jgi:hypothetical protein
VVVAVLALTAAVVAAFARLVVFDLQPEPYADSVHRFAAGPPEVEILPRSPWTSLPRILPGPADGWAGGTVHAVSFRLRSAPGGALVFHVELGDPGSLEPASLLVRREALPASAAPPRLTVAVNGAAVAALGEATRVEGGRTIHHRVRIPAVLRGRDAALRLSLVNEAGGSAALTHVRLVPVRPSFAWRHLGRRGRFPPESALFLAGSLAALLAWRPCCRATGTSSPTCRGGSGS